jgi:1-acyl-sn-glycerol-3-phosphate acyltransferase
MIASTLVRRLVSISIVILMFLVTTIALPALILLAGLVDLGRGITSRKPAMATRMMAFLWAYLLGEIWALLTILVIWPRSPDRRVPAAFRLQERWAAWNFSTMCWIFGLTIRATGLETIAPAPILVLARHASLVDTMLPARFVVREHGIYLRYILKRELLLDPVIDIGGNWLPNHFVDRGAGGLETELAAIRDLGAGMTEAQGMLIYPEGTRYSEEKRVRYVAQLARKGGSVGEIASEFRRVLPPRPAGTLALLESTVADIVVLAHRGLEGFARVKDIWAGGLVGSNIDVHFWRVDRESVPLDRTERIEWLYHLWLEVDSWVAQANFAR